MAKKVLIISSSPRKGGNSDLLCDEFMKGAIETGNEVEKIFLKDKMVHPCTGCSVCSMYGKPCPQKDDAAEIVEKMIAADVIVMATPVYFYTMCGQMKIMIDRCCARYTEITNKEFYFIIAAAEDNKAMMERTIDGFRGFLDCLEGPREKGTVYPCFCSRAELHAANAPHASDGTYIYAGTCRGLSAAEVAERSLVKRPALRVMVPKLSDPAGSIEFIDGVYGLQSTVLARDCGDFVVRRSDGVCAYQLAVVVDDAAMGVNHVVRAHDLMGSSGRQRYLQHVLGLGEVEYFHVPLLVAPDGRRLAKRDFDLDLGSLRTWMRGPERLLGLLAWKVGFIERFEPMSAAELVGEFSWDKVAARRDDIVVDEALVDALRG